MIRFQLKLLFFALLSLSSLYVKAQTISVDKVRDQFFAMDKSEDAALKLFKSLENKDLSKNPVMMAYRGASSAASAGSVSGVRKKLQYFSDGKAEIEKAIGLKPLDAEIRFLRLATQVNAPGFLGYNSDVKADKAIILQTLTSVGGDHANAYLYNRICRFLLAQVPLENTERQTVNQLIVKFNTRK